MEKRHLLVGEKKRQNYYLLVFGIVLLIVLLFYFYISFFDVKIGEEKSSEGVLDRASKPLKSLKDIFSGKEEIITSPVGNIRTFNIIESVPLFKFAIIGDYGEATRPNEAAVANLVKSWNVDFIITTGDNNYPNGAASTIDANIGQFYQEFIYPYTGSYGSGSPTLENRFFPSLGNHDWNTAGAVPYLNYFSLPGNERYYDFVKGNVHFYVMDSDPNEPDGTSASSTQASWLQDRLANSPEPLKIVYFHHAAYSSGNVHGSTTYMRWPFEAWGASAVFGGHDHLYERLTVGGIPYFVNGLGGASIYGFGSPLAESQARYSGNYGAMLVDVYNNKAIFKFININNQVIDSYTVIFTPQCDNNGIKDYWEECDGNDFGLANGGSLCVDYDSSRYISGNLVCNSCSIDFSQCVIRGVCGNGIVEMGEECDDGNNIDDDGCSASCTVEIPPCVLTNAYWSKTSAIEKENVNLIVEGTNCDGKVVELAVYEDEDGADENINANIAGVNFVGGTASGTWTAEWQCDGLDILGICLWGEPEYYFNAVLREDSTNSISSEGRANGLLTVQELNPTCGNGIPQTGEECDDGNVNNNDACTNICKNNVCNDGILYSGVEICDKETRDCKDVNNYNGVENCLNDCSGFDSICVTTERCGDNVLNGNEVCDKGVLNGQPNQCNLQCSGITASICGNSISEAGEDCDDGNEINSDACTTLCELTICGDGVVQNPNGQGSNEICDDGLMNGQPNKCNSQCTGITSSLCGNGIQEAGEKCDDGNNIDTDSCTNACLDAICGDGIKHEGIEECDDGLTGSLSCSVGCKLTKCGDGIVQNPNGLGVSEICELGNEVECSDNFGYKGKALCSGTCEAYAECVATEFCGDRIIQPLAGEDCDDGNIVDLDGCSVTCKNEIIGALPDLLVTSPEANKEYKNTLVPLEFIASNADSCYYALDGVRKDSACNVNDVLNLRPVALNVPENHRIDIFAQNVNGQTTKGVDFSVLYTRSKGIRYDKFRGKGETTNLDDFSDLELGDIDLVLDDGVNGKIKFNEKLNLALEADLVTNIVDLDSNVNIEQKKIEIKSDVLKGLNKKASLTFRNIGFSDPKILRDGVDCSAADCVEISYTNGIYVVDVSGFSVYTVVEGQQPPPPADGGGPGSPGGNDGGSDGGGFVTPPKKDDKKNKSKEIVDVIVINGTGEELERVELDLEETQNVNVGEGTRIVLEVEGSGKGEVVDFSIEEDRVVMRVVKDDKKYEILSNEVVQLLLGDKEVYFGVRDIGQGRAIVTLGLEKESVEKEIGIVKPRWISYMLIGIVAMLVFVVAGLMYRYLQFKKS